MWLSRARKLVARQAQFLKMDRRGFWKDPPALVAHGGSSGRRLHRQPNVPIRGWPSRGFISARITDQPVVLRSVQAMVQAPPEHFPLAQVLPHFPQFAGSVCVSTPPLVHAVRGAAQVHAPPTQVEPPVQAA
jgi:hypothetical protein